MPERRRVLVTGCGRSGTMYTTRVLQKVGLAVEHEFMGAEGIVSWHYAFDIGWLPNDLSRRKAQQKGLDLGGRRNDYDFDVVLHQVRHPMKVIPSVAKVIGQEDFAYIASCIGVPAAWSCPGPLRAAAYWVRWNRAILRQKPDLTFKLEEFEQSWPRICQLLNIDAPLPKIPPANKYMGRGHPLPPVTMEDVEREDAFMAKAVKELADELGYVL